MKKVVATIAAVTMAVMLVGLPSSANAKPSKAGTPNRFNRVTKVDKAANVKRPTKSARPADDLGCSWDVHGVPAVYRIGIDTINTTPEGDCTFTDNWALHTSVHYDTGSMAYVPGTAQWFQGCSDVWTYSYDPDTCLVMDEDGDTYPEVDSGRLKFTTVGSFYLHRTDGVAENFPEDFQTDSFDVRYFVSKLATHTYLGVTRSGSTVSFTMETTHFSVPTAKFYPSHSTHMILQRETGDVWETIRDFTSSATSDVNTWHYSTSTKYTYRLVYPGGTDRWNSNSSHHEA